VNERKEGLNVSQSYGGRGKMAKRNKRKGEKEKSRKILSGWGFFSQEPHVPTGIDHACSFGRVFPLKNFDPPTKISRTAAL